MIKLLLSFLGGVPVKVWMLLALLVVSFFGYMYWHHHVFAQGAASVQVKFDAYVAKAKLTATQDAEKLAALQVKIDAQAQASNDALSKQFADLTAQIAALKARSVSYKPQKPLPADCKLDPDRVAQANAALSR